MKRFLIPTADERSWKFDRPVLFLGEWCRLYDRGAIWSRMDARVAEPYGLQPGQKERDLGYIETLCGQLLREASDALNNFHKTRHGERYWNIVIGHWLRRYVMVMFNRFFTVEQALKNHEISGWISPTGPHSLSTPDTTRFLLACNDDLWNHCVYARVLTFLGTTGEEAGAAFAEESTVTQHLTYGAGWDNKVKRLARHAATRVLPRLSRKHDAFILRSYLPSSVEFKLQLSLGQCPQLWRSPAVEAVGADPARRQASSLRAEKHTGFEAFVRQQFSAVIPSCFLEGYKQLVRQLESLPWPTEPKFIFTSNSFDTDEVFKVWAASKVEAGFPYFTGQHGNSYGTHLYAGNPNWPERSASDRFLTWGWSDESPTTVPAFMFKNAARKSSTVDARGGLLLVELCMTHRETPWDSYAEFGVYQEEQFRFVAALPELIRQQLTVRLHSGYRLHRWSDEQRWKDRSPRTRVDAAQSAMSELIRQNRLVVHSYDGTGVLESLSANIPTLCFWHPATDLLLPDAKPYYAMLRDAGIFLHTPEIAAETVALHWEDVGKWWGSQKVQVARQAFCDKYARNEERPVRTMKRLLLMPDGVEKRSS